MATAALQPLTENEKAAYPGFNYAYVLDATLGNITTSATNTEQVFTVFTTKAKYDCLRKVGVVVAEATQNTADAAYNTTTVRVGKTGTDNAYITASETNKNGTTVWLVLSTFTAEVYTAATAILVTLGAQSGKKLSDLNKGRIIVLFDLFRPSQDQLQRATGSETIIPS